MLVGSFNENERKEGEREKGREEGKNEKRKKRERYMPHSYLSLVIVHFDALRRYDGTLALHLIRLMQRNQQAI